MKDEKKDENERLVRLIHTLATRLPWIAVIGMIIAMLLIFLQAYFMGI